MAAMGNNTRGKMTCVKCKKRHEPPIEASCKQINDYEKMYGTNVSVFSQPLNHSLSSQMTYMASV